MQTVSSFGRASGLLIAVGLALGACQNTMGSTGGATGQAGSVAPATMAAAQPSLYNRLGGSPAIHVVVDEFVANVAADPVVNQRFAKTDIPAFKDKVFNQLCQASGGPCVYTGKDMLTAHRGMAVTEAEFNAMGGDMVQALTSAGVQPQEKDDVLTLLASMHNDIVGH